MAIALNRKHFVQGYFIMEIADLISPQDILPALRVTSKKQVLQELSKQAAEKTGLSERRIFEILIERERLGSTGVGHGIAIPHGKVPELEQIQAFFARLETPVDYEAVDEQPVDLVFMLLAPESAGADHLKALARVSRLMRNTDVCEKLRGSTTKDALYALMTQSEATAA